MDYMDKYNFWLTSPQFDEEPRKELEAIKGNDLVRILNSEQAVCEA